MLGLDFEINIVPNPASGAKHVVKPGAALSKFDSDLLGWILLFLLRRLVSQDVESETSFLMFTIFDLSVRAEVFLLPGTTVVVLRSHWMNECLDEKTTQDVQCTLHSSNSYY